MDCFKFVLKFFSKKKVVCTFYSVILNWKLFLNTTRVKNLFAVDFFVFKISFVFFYTQQPLIIQKKP